MFLSVQAKSALSLSNGLSTASIWKISDQKLQNHSY